MTDARQERDDELLSSYLDGELAPAEADELARRLAGEPALAERLAAMRAMDDATAGVFRALDERPMPERVLELLADEEDAADKVVPFRPARPPASFFQLPVAIAASIALVAGLWLGERIGNGAMSGDIADASHIAEGSQLYAAFEHGRSGETLELGDGRVAEPVLTFRSVGGVWCREVRMTGGGAPADALACRRDGGWQVEVVSFGPAAGLPGATPYGQASAEGAPAVRAAIEALIGPEPPLGSAEEAEVLGRRWAGSTE